MKYLELYQKQVLNDEFLKRKSKNSRFSLRAFAKFLDLDIATLSRVMAGQRILSKKNAAKVVDSLKLTSAQKKKFLGNSENQGNGGVSQLKETLLLDTYTYSKIIKEWEYFTFLDLVKTKSFKNDLDWISGRMGVSKSRVLEVMNQLISVGLLVRLEEGELKIIDTHVMTTDGVPSAVIQESHSEAMRIADQRLKEIDVLLRDFSTVTMPANLQKLPIIKEMLKKFRREVVEILQEGECEEVFQMNIQLFPLTKALP